MTKGKKGFTLIGLEEIQSKVWEKLAFFIKK